MSDPPARRRFIMQWHITHRCNLRCRHCYQTEYAACPDEKTLFDTLDWFSRFLEKTDRYGHIYLTGGEPLTHPAFFPLLREIRRREMRLCVLTNGTLIDNAAADRLAWYLPEFVQVSLDGDRAAHDAVRGQGSFDAALAGIDRLVERDVPVLVSFTAQKGNLGSFPALARVCRAHGVRKLWWDRVVPDSPEAAEQIALTTRQFRRFCLRAHRMQKRYLRPDGGSMIACERALQFLGGGDPNACYTCHAGQDMVTVLADGAVMPCRRLPFAAGNALETELDQILAGDARTASLVNAPIPAACAGCPHAERCRGGAKCVTYGVTGQLFAKDVNCFYR